MQLTRAADYAVRVMIHLAGLPPGSRASRGELAREAECPEQFLSKVLQSLTRAGLVISHRGNTGGFELPEANRGASILKVVQAIEGPVRLNLCLTSDHACGRQEACSAHKRLGRSAGGHDGRLAERLHRQPGRQTSCREGKRRAHRRSVRSLSYVRGSVRGRIRSRERQRAVFGDLRRAFHHRRAAASATIASITRSVASAVCGIDSARLNGFAKSP